MAVQFLLSGRAAVPKSKQIINLGRRSFRARVLYFGYSRRDESRATVPSDSMGARAEMVRFNEAMTNED